MEGYYWKMTVIYQVLLGHQLQRSWEILTSNHFQGFATDFHLWQCVVSSFLFARLAKRWPHSLLVELFPAVLFMKSQCFACSAKSVICFF